MIRSRLAVRGGRRHGIRWLSSSSTIPPAQARVEAVDNGLVMLRPNNLQDTGRLKPGSIFRTRDAQGNQSAVVAMFKLRDAIFGASMSEGSSSLLPGVVLQQRNEEELRLDAEANKKVFDDPPRDMARTPITQSWFFNEPVLDLMTPVGRGQSMIFFLHPEAKLLKSMESALLDQHVAVYYPDTKSTHTFQKDNELNACLASHIGMSRAETKRDTAEVPVVMMIDDLTPFRRVWERAERMFRKRKFETTGDKAFLEPEKKIDRTDLRHYYSTFIQRAARLKDGNKSLTLLLRVPRIEDAAAIDLDSVKHREFSLDEFEQEVKAGIRPLEDFERLVRLRVKTGNRIKLTAETLTKLQISLPASAGGGVAAVEDATHAKMHGEELMSIVDGHVVVPRTFKDFCLDPRASLTRIGAGSNKNEVRDTRPLLTRSLASGLRIEVADLYESVHANPEKARKKLDAWKRALNMKSPLQLDHDMGRFEGALLYAVKKGLFAGENVPKFNLEEIKKLDLAMEHEAQLERLAKCVQL